MEKELHNDEFWGFLTNSEIDNYPTRIALVLDLISKKIDADKEAYRTFFYFDDEHKKGKSLEEIWNEIQHNFLTLKEWFFDHEFCHKIGYLVASDSKKLIDIMNDYTDKSKTEFREYLDESIRDSINFKKPYNELDYVHDYNEIKNVNADLFPLSSSFFRPIHSDSPLPFFLRFSYYYFLFLYSLQ